MNDANVVGKRVHHLKMATLAIEEIATNKGFPCYSKTFFGLVKNFMGENFSAEHLRDVIEMPLSELFGISEKKNEAKRQPDGDNYV